MAELRVQPKKKTIWPLVLIALLVIAAILYFTVFRSGVYNGSNNAPPENTTDTTIKDTTAK